MKIHAMKFHPATREECEQFQMLAFGICCDLRADRCGMPVRKTRPHPLRLRIPYDRVRPFVPLHPATCCLSHRPTRLWQRCGKNPDFAAKTDVIDKFLLNGISNLCVCSASRLHPAYRLIRH